MTDVPDFRRTTIETLVGQVKGGALSAAAVTDAALERIEHVNPTLNAFVAIDADGGPRPGGRYRRAHRGRR